MIPLLLFQLSNGAEETPTTYEYEANYQATQTYEASHQATNTYEAGYQATSTYNAEWD